MIRLTFSRKAHITLYVAIGHDGSLVVLYIFQLKNSKLTVSKGLLGEMLNIGWQFMLRTQIEL